MTKSYILISLIDDKLSGNHVEILYVGTRKEIKENVEDGKLILKNIKKDGSYRYNLSTSFIIVFLEDLQSHRKTKYIEAIWNDGFEFRYYDNIEDHLPPMYTGDDDEDWDFSEGASICIYDTIEQKEVKSYSNLNPDIIRRKCR